MLLNYSKFKKNLSIIILPIWVLIGFLAANIVVVLIVRLLSSVGVPLGSMNEVVLNAVLTTSVYLVALGIVISLPLYIRSKRRITLVDIGLNGLPTWTNLLMAPAGLVFYFVLSAVMMLLAIGFIPGFKVDQPQDIGFSGLNGYFEYILAFIVLVVVAPLAEESLFRGYLYGKLRQTASIWASVLITSALFGFAHGAWNLAMDTFALSVVLCVMREMTGNIWASILLHMIKNGIAFYFLFISPMLIR